MKMKKLLSIGALALVIASSMSIGASAETQDANSKTKLLIKIVASQYNNGQNQTGLFSGVDKNTKIGDSKIASDGFVNQVNATYGNSTTVNKAITKYESNKDETVSEVLAKATKDQATFDKFKGNFSTVLGKLQDMDKLTGTERGDKERAFKALVNTYNSSLDVTFGKNGAGKTTASITNAGDLVIDLNSEDFQAVINKVNDTNWSDVQGAKNLLK